MPLRNLSEIISSRLYDYKPLLFFIQDSSGSFLLAWHHGVLNKRRVLQSSASEVKSGWTQSFLYLKESKTERNVFGDTSTADSTALWQPFHIWQTDEQCCQKEFCIILAKAEASFSRSDEETAIHAVIPSHVDYWNALCQWRSLNRLQLVLNAAAWLFRGTSRRELIAPGLRSLHWLPVISEFSSNVHRLLWFEP